MHTTRVFFWKYTTHPKEKLIWDIAKVDDKKEYWQKYHEKEEEIADKIFVWLQIIFVAKSPFLE